MHNDLKTLLKYSKDTFEYFNKSQKFANTVSVNDVLTAKLIKLDVEDLEKALSVSGVVSSQVEILVKLQVLFEEIDRLKKAAGEI